MLAEEGRGGHRGVAEVSGAAAASAAAVTAASPPPAAGARSGDANAAERSSGTGADAAPGSGIDAGRSSSAGGVEEGAGARGEQRPAAGGVEQRDFEWFAVPGGRERPPELDEDGNEKGPAAAAGKGGATSVDGAVDLVGQSSAGGAAVNGAAETGAVSPRVEEAEATCGGGGGGGDVASRKLSDGMPASPPPRPVASRVGAVNVLSPAASTTARARAVAGSSGDRSIPRVAPAGGAVGAGSSAGSSNGGGSPAEDEEAGRIEWQRAMSILDDMEAADHLPPPPAEAFQAVLDACDAAGRVGEALEVASAMVGTGHSPSKRLISRLMESHADVLERERKEREEAAAEPAEAWGTGE